MTLHHTEVFSDGSHHKMQRYRDLVNDPDPDYDGDKYIFDERCEKCREERDTRG